MRRRTFALIMVLLTIVIVVGVGTYLIINPPGQHQGPVNLPTSVAVTPTPTVLPSSKCGVKQHSDGSYRFPWLHVSSAGMIVNEAGCVVPLVGFNMGALAIGDASGGTKSSKIAWYKQTFKMNLARVNFNSLWWDEDVFVPAANMHYRQWLQTYVKWQEQNGNYVELDEGPHFPEPPCGGSITFCPAQNQGDLDYKASPGTATAAELMGNIAPGIQAWKDLARIYADDPAILYDAWNEPTLTDMPVFFRDMNTLIDTIRTQNPRSLVIVFGRGWKGIVKGAFPNYTQPNLIMDAHIYDGFNGISPATGQLCSEPGGSGWTPDNSGFAANVDFAQSHGQGVIINEWGGCYNSPGYNQIIITFAKNHGLALAYFQAGNVVSGVSGGGLELNANGRLVQAGYASIMSGVSG